MEGSIEGVPMKNPENKMEQEIDSLTTEISQKILGNMEMTVNALTGEEKIKFEKICFEIGPSIRYWEFPLEISAKNIISNLESGIRNALQEKGLEHDSQNKILSVTYDFTVFNPDGTEKTSGSGDLRKFKDEVRKPTERKDFLED